ncbi:MAG TPA: RDD family protein [bacterium]|nr:RDD family protein [bacterium]
MRREIHIRTPENVEFGFRLAGLFSRALAAAIDYALVALLAGLLITALGFAAIILGLSVPGIGTFASAGAIALLVLGLFLLLFGYFLFFELLWNGQTPGKRAVGIRVVKDRGEAIGFADALVRNLLRMADIIPGFYGVGALSSVLSETNKRLGDFAAGTVVVVLEAQGAPEEGSERGERHNSLAEDALLAARIRKEITPEETELVRDVWARRGSLDAAGRARVLARVARHLRERFALPDMPFLSDEQLLRDVLDVVRSERSPAARQR